MRMCRAVYAIALGLSIGWPGTGEAGPIWDLASDFRIFPNQANPNPDGFGNSDVWYFMRSTTLARDPATYVLLDEFIADAFSVPGLQQWQGLDAAGGVKNKLPAVGINATGAFHQVLSIAWPDGVVRVHPSSSELVVVGWRSPISGVVNVSGSFNDLDPDGGNGVLWFIDHGRTNLAGGDILNGGANGFRIPAVSVAEGDFLYFVVHPKGFNHGFDSTGVSLTISAVPEPSTLVLVSCAGLVGLAGVGRHLILRQFRNPNPKESGSDAERIG